MQNREIITLKLLTPNRGKAEWLEQITQNYSQVVEQGIQAALAAKAKSRRQVHDLSYPLARRAGLSGVHARLVVQDVLSAVRCYQRSDNLPGDRLPGFGLGSRAYKLHCHEDRWALGIFQGNGNIVWFPLNVPEKYEQRLECVSGDARLVKRKGDWFVLLPVQREQPALRAITPAATFIGLDLGVVRLVTAFTPERVLVIDGLTLRHRRQFFRKLAENYRCAGRLDRVKKLAARERYWMRDHNHTIACQLIALAQQSSQPVLVLENLDGLHYRKVRSERFAAMSLAWDFRQLVSYLEYKAHQAGIHVIFVDPRGTSNTCPECKYLSSGNALQNGRFHCQKCGYFANTDVVAARNLAGRGRELCGGSHA